MDTNLRYGDQQRNLTAMPEKVKWNSLLWCHTKRAMQQSVDRAILTSHATHDTGDLTSHGGCHGHLVTDLTTHAGGFLN